MAGESIVSLFFPYLNTYRTLLLRIEHCKTEKTTIQDFLIRSRLRLVGHSTIIRSGKFNIGYSTKNIPLPWQNDFL